MDFTFYLFEWLFLMPFEPRIGSPKLESRHFERGACFPPTFVALRHRLKQSETGRVPSFLLF